MAIYLRIMFNAPVWGLNKGNHKEVQEDGDVFKLGEPFALKLSGFDCFLVFFD